MTNVKFLKGNKASLPSVGVDDSTIYFVEDNAELYKSVGDGLPLSKISDVFSGYVDLSDLKSKNPSLEEKLYLCNDNKLYTYRNNTYELLSGNIKVNADDIVESPNKVLVSPSQRSQIDSNTAELSSHTQRLSEMQQEINNLVTTAEKVSMDAISAGTYLSELIDGITLKNINGKLTVESLTGLNANIDELNYLQGVNRNIQQQINNLSGMSSFRGVFTSLEQLELASNPQAGEYAIVSKNDISDYYFYYGSNWDFSHSATGVSEINLSTGTVGILPKNRYEKQSASDISILDANNNLVATNLEDAIAELFQYVNNGKTSVATAIDSSISLRDTFPEMVAKIIALKNELAMSIRVKGIDAQYYDDLSTMASKILSLPNVTLNSTVKKFSKLNVTAGNSIDIILDYPLNISDITTSIIEYVRGATGVVHYDLNFDNGDSTDFEYNEFVIYDGKMKLKNNYKAEIIPDNTWNKEGLLFRQSFDLTKFKNINKLELSTKVV